MWLSFPKDRSSISNRYQTLESWMFERGGGVYCHSVRACFQAHAQIIPSRSGPLSMSEGGEIEPDDIRRVMCLSGGEGRRGPPGSAWWSRPKDSGPFYRRVCSSRRGPFRASARCQNNEHGDGREEIQSYCKESVCVCVCSSDERMSVNNLKVKRLPSHLHTQTRTKTLPACTFEESIASSPSFPVGPTGVGWRQQKRLWNRSRKKTIPGLQRGLGAHAQICLGALWMMCGLYSVLPENECLRWEFEHCWSNASVNVDRGIWCLI